MEAKDPTMLTMEHTPVDMELLDGIQTTQFSSTKQTTPHNTSGSNQFILDSQPTQII
jgi:hypothetical protein